MTTDRASQNIKIDERNHVEKPLLDQLSGLDWEIIDLTDEKQNPVHTFRENFTEVVMPPVLREQLKKINGRAGGRSDRGGGQAAYRKLSRHGSDREQPARPAPADRRTPASAKTGRQARKARPFVLSILRIGTTTALSPSASSRFGFWAPSTISFRTSCCS